MIIPLSTIVDDAELTEKLAAAINAGGGCVVIVIPAGGDSIPFYLDIYGDLIRFDDADGRGEPKVYKRVKNAIRVADDLTNCDFTMGIAAIEVALWVQPMANNPLPKYVKMCGRSQWPGSTRR